MYEGRDRATNEVKWSATAVDLVFGANPSFGSSRSFMPAATEGDVRA
jgi:catalase (peroxidase I)